VDFRSAMRPCRIFWASSRVSGIVVRRTRTTVENPMTWWINGVTGLKFRERRSTTFFAEDRSPRYTVPVA
jgi:hypothetical protein